MEDLGDLEGGEEMEMGDEEAELELEGKKEVEEAKAELNEAINVINTLKSELNEVNLLNAKLLYVNKLFRSKTLTEAQKVKVINAFDRAESVKEVKNIFETLKDSVTTGAKKAVNESRSFASKAAGVAPKTQIVESNDFVKRMQKIAGII
jgi:prolyl oligopeptidase PreP (S9A serine peptidase family)